MLKRYTFKKNPLPSIKKVKYELEKIGFELTDVEDDFKGRNYIFILEDIEITYSYYDKKYDSYFTIGIPSNKFSVTENQINYLEEQIEIYENLVKALKIIRKLIQ